MKPRLFFTALLACAALSALPGQEAPEDAPDSGLFPLSLLLDAAASGEFSWRPDWPAAMPPDGFALVSGRAVSLVLVLPAGYLDGPPGGVPDAADASAPDGASDAASGNAGGNASVPGGAPVAASGNASAPGNAAGGTAEDGGEAAAEYRLVRDGVGRLVEFPFLLNGVLCQAGAEYGDAGPAAAEKIVLDNPAAPDPWEFEFLEYRQGAPALARIGHGGAWSFAAPEYLETRTNETWYDADGLALGFCSLEYRQEDGARRLVAADSRSDQDERIVAYDYNSAGRVSGISAPEGEYAALYNAAARPRYWERPDGAYALQWDEQGFLVRIAGVFWGGTSLDGASPDGTSPDGTSPDGTSPDGTGGEPQPIDIRYEYTLDERGNWIERRETAFVRRFGRLVPGSETAIHRIINYGGSDYGARR